MNAIVGTVRGVVAFNGSLCSWDYCMHACMYGRIVCVCVCVRVCVCVCICTQLNLRRFLQWCRHSHTFDLCILSLQAHHIAGTTWKKKWINKSCSMKWCVCVCVCVLLTGPTQLMSTLVLEHILWRDGTSLTSARRISIPEISSSAERKKNLKLGVHL